MNVNLNDENGVNISSSGNLSLGASGGISLSGGSVSISGSNKVLVQKSKSSYISLEGECYNQSNAVYENGSCRETYEPFTDDDPQNGVAEALAELEYKNELLSLSILGSNVMLNVVMQNDKINKMPKTYKGIPMSGSELEKRMDIATFDATKKYKEGTMVKFKSLDGEYILGEAGKSAPCAGGVSAFKAYDKSSYKGHNSPKDAIKSMGYGALDFVNTSLDSISDLAFDACKYVTTRGIFDESTKNKIVNSFDWLKEQKGKPSDLLHEHFKNESPHKETFEATKIGLDMLTLLDSGIGAVNYCGKLSKIKKLNAAEKVANSKKAENILNELNKEILGVNKGIGEAVKTKSEIADSYSNIVKNIRDDIKINSDVIRSSDDFKNLSKTQQKKLERKLNSLENGGNIAVADVDIPGVKSKFQAHSKINSETHIRANVGDFSYKTENRKLTTYVDAEGYSRYHDTEAKILEDIEKSITDPNVKGKVDLYSELDCCQSCSNLILEFRRNHPNIDVNIYVESMKQIISYGKEL
ncbi:deaminase domain-containing protein [Clostridium sp. ZBS20]|uniref:deaminase domain-containing protein n=1 Tax=Clostridium sp. ZBS20 TaxID=2949966 RepID=UPI00207A44CA|nr:deaminase domain-containing protein [Clostridium sp. ZBS20]